MTTKPPIGFAGDDGNPWYDHGLLDGDTRRRHFIGQAVSGELRIQINHAAQRVDLLWTGYPDEMSTALAPLTSFIQSARAMRSLASGRTILPEYKPAFTKRYADGRHEYFLCTMPDSTTGYGIASDGTLVWSDDRRFPLLEREVQQYLLIPAEPVSVKPSRKRR